MTGRDDQGAGGAPSSLVSDAATFRRRADGSTAPRSAFVFAVADRGDDAALRRRLAADVMHGSIAITFRREPSYFDSTHLQGTSTTVIKCTRRDDGAVVGMSCRSLQRSGIDGEAHDVAYLSDLRGDATVRGGTLLARGFRALAQVHRRQPVGFSYAVIYEGNDGVRDLLTSGRLGMPGFRAIDRLLTPALHLDFARPGRPLAGVEARRAQPRDREAIVALLAREWARKTLARADPGEAWAHGEYRSVAVEDMFVATRGHEVVACLAAWDQGRFRQTHVEGYAGALRWLRGPINLFARLSPLKPLPAPGQRIPHGYFGMIASDGNDPALFDALLRHACNAMCGSPWHYAIVGLCESDPLSGVLAGHRRIHAAGVVHAVRFAGDAPELFDRVERARVRYVEAGCL